MRKLPSEEIMDNTQTKIAKLTKEGWSMETIKVGASIQAIVDFLDKYASLFEHADELVELVRKNRKHRKLYLK